MNYITEKYFGKTPILEKAELILGKLLNEMKKDPLKNYTTHPLNLKLCELLKKQFNFKNVYIRWDRSAEYRPRICTLSNSNVFFKLEKIKGSNSRGYYDNGSSVCYIIADSMITHLNFTAEEYMGVIIHEIGHNFDSSMYYAYSLMTTYLQCISRAIKDSIYWIQPVLIAIQTSNTGKQLISQIDKVWETLLEKVPLIKKIAYEFNKVISTYYRWREILYAPIDLIRIPYKTFMAPSRYIINSITRKTEQFADSFAATYGYAAPLGRALKKLNYINMSKRMPKENEVTRFMRDIVLLSNEVFQVCNATHGNTGTRIMSNIQYLRSEIKSSQCPPEMKEVLVKQLKDTEEVYQSYINGGDEEKIVLTTAFRKAIDKFFGGRADFVSRFLPDIKTKWESSNDIDNIMLEIYEACYNNEITEYERDMLLSLYE